MINLIDRYVREVGNRLPRKNRADIEAEIRSTLEDMVEDRSRSTGKPADDTLIRAILKEYGSPQSVAESYAPPRYVIGPRLYPIFELVLRIVTAVLLAVNLITFGIQVSSSGHMVGPNFISALGDFLLGLIGSIITALGNITLVFAILERTVPSMRIGDEKDWDPAELEKEKDPDQVDIGDQIATIIFTAAGLVIINLFPNIIGAGFAVDGQLSFYPMLTDTFYRFLPWINLLCVVQIVFAIFLLRQRFWNLPTRLCHIVIDVLGIMLVAAMLSGPAVAVLPAEAFAGSALAGNTAMLNFINAIPTFALVIVILVQIIETAVTVARLFFPHVRYPKIGK